jgi:hypothetical protein
MIRKRSLVFVGIAVLVGGAMFDSHGREQGESANEQVVQPRGGFTGPDVPSLEPLRGDYVHTGVKTADGRTDVARLMSILERMNARDYMHLVWGEKNYPSSWEDFKLLCPVFQKAGRRLWLYLTPPSEPPPPEPFGHDYVRWAVECAKLAKEYPAVAGLCIDDFNGNVKTFTPAYCKEMMQSAHAIAPHLALLVVCYFGYYEKTIAAHVETGAIDGVIFPYFYPHRNHSDTASLMPQIETYRKWLDRQTAQGGLSGRMPLVVMVYGTQHSASPDLPIPSYIKDCLSIGLKATENGLADGVVTYCLPKDNPPFVEAVAVIYKR